MSVEPPTDSFPPRNWASILLWLGVLLLGGWCRWPSPWWLVGVASVTVLWSVAYVKRSRARNPTMALAAVVLLAGSLSGFGAHFHLQRMSLDWPSVWERREARAVEELTEALDALLASGEEAARRTASLASEPSESASERILEEIRAETGMAAVALYEPGGVLTVWSGSHRGPVPATVSTGHARFAYGERPLFSYLYVTAPVPATGGTAVAAALLRADLPAGLGGESGDFAFRIRARTGESIRVSRADRAGAGPESVWDLRWEDRVLFSVSLEEPEPAAERQTVLDRWMRVLALLALGAWLLLALGARRARLRLGLAAGSLLALAMLLPPGPLLAMSELGSPAAFLLPGPGSVTLGRALSLAAAGLVLLGLLGFREPGRARPGLALALAVTMTLGLIHLFRGAATGAFLARSDAGVALVQIALASLLTLGLLTALLLAADPERDDFRPGVLVAALLGAVGLAFLGTFWIRAHGQLPLWWALLWLGPGLLLLRTPGSTNGPLRRTSLVVGAGVLSVSLALVFVWSQQVEARMDVGEREMDRLGAQTDPYLEFLLHRFSARVDSLSRSGAGPVELLYRGWSLAGLAEEGVPVWLTLWSSADVPREELRIGLAPPRPAVADDFLDRVREEGTALVRRFETADAHYGAFVPLSGGQVVTAVVPPRRMAGGGPALGPLFGSVGDAARDPLTLVPLLPGDAPTAPDSVGWVRDGEGWRAERTLTFPDGAYHAHYRVELPDGLVLLARGTILLFLDGLILALLAGIGLGLGLERLPRFGSVGRVLGTFQARITAALFAFFLLSIAIFGTLAFRTLTGAATRTSEALAERVGEEAAGWYLEVQGSMDLLARRVGADLLEYRDGELVGGSVSELVELGLYEGWLPYDVYRTLNQREALRASRVGSVGGWDYVMAYRRLPDGDVLASPVPLRAGATAVRRREMTDLLGFAVILGGALSLGLALLVGRALARPIRMLRVASERVGTGDLEVRIPDRRPDEFGAVFRAFNRMVTRLRTARTDLVRTTRRTQAIVEEAATGVVALDARGRVTLVNPRAEELLGEEIPVGEAVPAGTDAAAELFRWLELYFRDGLREAGAELHVEDRRIRIQARRIPGRERLGGAVVSLEDVTDELRTERILAWGEMARQVAHEVKNPLTPIKLSVQHIFRAWEDRRPDFGEILRRNVEAILREIEGLASIARSFSEFGAPRLAGEEPVEPVDVARVVDETLGLYATGEGRVRFESGIPDELPRVRARKGELKEVLVNLLENARAAIAADGRVVVEASASGAEVELVVRDDGQGIPEELLPRVFEPQFSTRSTGTGLGLAIVRRLVESWGGKVGAESEPGDGATIRLILPIWTDGEEAPTPGDQTEDSTP